MNENNCLLYLVKSLLFCMNFLGIMLFYTVFGVGRSEKFLYECEFILNFRIYKIYCAHSHAPLLVIFCNSVFVCFRVLFLFFKDQIMRCMNKKILLVILLFGKY